jgi:small subunit ribosomal protein S6
MAEPTVNTYEAMFLIGQAATSENEGGLALVRGMLERQQIQPLVMKKWDERKLAFEIGKAKRGTYIVAFFKATGTAVAAIERDVKLSEDFLRVMTLRADHLNETEMAAVEPQPIAPPREERSWDRPSYDDRAPRGDRGNDRGGDRGDRPSRPRREDSPEAAMHE